MSLAVTAAGSCDGCRTYSNNDGQAGLYCDRHQVPPVCVCDDPDPDIIGECRDCRRPYRPQVDGFMACRLIWQLHLDREAAA